MSTIEETFYAVVKMCLVDLIRRRGIGATRKGALVNFIAIRYGVAILRDI